jgi:hypothetical protein
VGVGSNLLIFQGTCELAMGFVVLDSNLVKHGLVCVFLFPYFID